MSTVTANHPSGDSRASASGVRSGHTSPQPATVRRQFAQSREENWGELSSPRQHAAAWRIALQTEQPTPGGLAQRTRWWLTSWAIALSLCSARMLLGLVEAILPPRLRDSCLPSIRRLDTRGPIPALRRAAAAASDRDTFAPATATTAQPHALDLQGYLDDPASALNEPPASDLQACL